MLNIADFGGFTGLAKLIKTVKATAGKLDNLAKNTHVQEITDFKIKYVDTLDRFRPNNTDEIPKVVGDFGKDTEVTVAALKAKLESDNPAEYKEAEEVFIGCKDDIDKLLNIVMTALEKAK